MYIPIEDDRILENIESFILTLERTSDLDSRITLDPVNGVVEIIDNDGRYDDSDTVVHRGDTCNSVYCMGRSKMLPVLLLMLCAARCTQCL